MDDLTNWPKESKEYKVVQMVVDEEPCVRFQDDSDDRHSDIIKTLCNKLKRNFTATKDTEIFKIDNLRVPDLKSEWYEVVGAGKVDVDVMEHQILFSGDSYGYKIAIRKDHLQKMQSLYPEWKLKY